MDGGRFDRMTRLVGRGMSRRGAAKLAATGVVAAGGSRLAAVPAMARQATPGAGDACPTTSLEENKALIERYWSEIISVGSETPIGDIVAEDEVHHWGVFDDTVGLDAFAERRQRLHTAFPDYAIEVEQLVAEGDMIASRWLATGTHEGDWLGFPATGTEVSYFGMNLFRIECGKIAEAWGTGDHLSLLLQIGAVADLATPATE